MTSARPHLRLVPAAPTEPSDEPELSDLDGVFRRYAPYVARVGARILGRAGEAEGATCAVTCTAACNVDCRTAASCTLRCAGDAAPRAVTTTDQCT